MIQTCSEEMDAVPPARLRMAFFVLASLACAKVRSIFSPDRYMILGCGNGIKEGGE